MLKILNEHYYLDLDAIDKYIQIDNESSEVTMDTHVSITKYEIIKLMLEVIMDDMEGVDETLGGKSSELPISFKIAFNTLLNKKLLNKY